LVLKYGIKSKISCQFFHLKAILVFKSIGRLKYPLG